MFKYFLSLISMTVFSILCLAQDSVLPIPPSTDSSEGEISRIPKPNFDYICWDAHRYSRTEKDFMRDMQYLKDLGFTHTFISQILGPDRKGSRANDDNLISKINACNKVGILAGVKPDIPVRSSEVIEIVNGLQMTTGKKMYEKERLGEEGILYTRKAGAGGVYNKRTGQTSQVEEDPEALKTGGLNIMHPEFIEALTKHIVDYVKIATDHDKRGCIRLFLMGTEIKWGLPNMEVASLSPAAIQVIMDAAIADGAVKPGTQYDPENKDLQYWWNDAYGHGKCWRLRKSVEDGIMDIIPDANFMIDPAYAIKIVHGFGASWSYIHNDPRRVAVGGLTTKARSWPGDSCQSTQLIQGATRDLVLEANLLLICLGINKVYHWGVHQIEPGANAHYMIARKVSSAAKSGVIKKSEEALYGARSQLDKNLVQKYTDQIEKKRIAIEPSLRSTGHLLNERGAMFRDWKPVQAPVAVFGTGFGVSSMSMLLLSQNVQFDLISRREHMKEKLKDYKIAIVMWGNYSNEEIELLRQFARQGKVILVDDGSVEVTGGKGQGAIPKIPSTAVWKVSSDPKEKNSRLGGWYIQSMRVDSAELQQDLHEKGKKLMELIRGSGYSTYCDTKQDNAITRAYDYQGQKVIMAVNDKRVISSARKVKMDEDDDDVDDKPEGNDESATIDDVTGNKKKETKAIWDEGVENKVELFVNDPDEIEVIDIDTGKPIPVTKGTSGWVISDTLEGNWYRLYGIVKKGEAWKGPGPLPAGEEIKNFKAVAQAEGVKLTWNLPSKDWVGCKVQWYDIYRGSEGKDPIFSARIYGRPTTGPGGVITEYVDKFGKKGDKYTIKAISPLRVPGPMSELVSVN